MRLQISRSKNSASLYVIKSTYINKVHSTQIVEKLGTEAELREKLNGADPYVWAKEYIKNLNEEEKLQKRNVTISYSQSKFIEQDEKRLFNGGYLFLQQIYNELGLEKICKDISKKYDFKYNLNSILSRLIYGRVLFPEHMGGGQSFLMNFLRNILSNLILMLIKSIELYLLLQMNQIIFKKKFIIIVLHLLIEILGLYIMIALTTSLR